MTTVLLYTLYCSIPRDLILQSYGGYMAGMVGSSGSGVFRAAISQSPVTDWLYYGQQYTGCCYACFVTLAHPVNYGALQCTVLL